MINSRWSFRWTLRRAEALLPLGQAESSAAEAEAAIREVSPFPPPH